MADAVKWSDKLKGAFEFIFLFGRGILPFEKDPTKAAALRSILIQALLFPFSLYCAYLWPPKDLTTQPMQTVQAITALSNVIGFFASWGVLWLASVAFNKRDRFWLTFQASNWVSIPLSLVSVPFLIAALLQWYPHAQMDNVFTMLTYYGVVVGACVAFRGLKVGWELAGFIACMNVVVGQQIWNGLFWLFDVPINWGA